MMHYLRVFLYILAAAGLGCNKVASDSEVSGALTEKTPVCSDYSTAQYAQLRNDLANLDFFHNFNESELGQLIKHFHAVPRAYRALMINASKSGDFRGFFKENIAAAGVCFGGRAGCSKISLSSTQRNVIQFSLIHEVGHGMEAQVRRNSGMSRADFETVLESLLLEGREHNAGPNARTRETRIRSYSFSSIHEFWADSFHNYYCSPESNAFIKKYLPKNYEFLQTVLEAPVWADEDEAPVDPEEDGRALEYFNALLSLHNEASKTCDLALKSIGESNASGDFIATVTMNGATQGSDAAKSAELVLNLNKNFSRELSELRRGLPAYFPACASE